MATRVAEESPEEALCAEYRVRSTEYSECAEGCRRGVKSGKGGGRGGGSEVAAAIVEGRSSERNESAQRRHRQHSSKAPTRTSKRAHAGGEAPAACTRA